ncbi:hypothetical protein GCM10010430_41430 [Kitasatospora cystarginea]|uniref:WXG100 family type VII secretion target n=1 Tax=Kitasatospora cystarginea TaxID=58350 RepID=A0ABN3EAZ0_9ACTN
MQWTLEQTGAIKLLEKVTGAPELLTEAAKDWQQQAVEMQKVADDLRTGARQLSANWHGQASEAFGRHMGEIVQAMDGTADDMAQTAGILGQAAAECALAEETVIHLITELIDLLVGMLATSFILDLFTAGLATVVDALVSEAEVAVYIAKIEKVSAGLAKTLRELMDAVKELKAAERAGKSVEEVKKARQAVRAAAKVIRQNGSMLKNPNGLSFRDRLAHHVVAGQLGEHTLGAVEHGLGMENNWKDPLKEFLTSDTGQRSLDPHGTEEPEPYHVDRSRIEEAFG